MRGQDAHATAGETPALLTREFILFLHPYMPRGVPLRCYCSSRFLLLVSEGNQSHTGEMRDIKKLWSEVGRYRFFVEEQPEEQWALGVYDKDTQRTHLEFEPTEEQAKDRATWYARRLTDRTAVLSWQS